MSRIRVEYRGYMYVNAKDKEYAEEYAYEALESMKHYNMDSNDYEIIETEDMDEYSYEEE